MYQHILLPVDLGHPESFRKAVPVAAKLADSFDACLHVMTVVPDYGMSIVGQFFPKQHEGEMLAEAQKLLHAFTDEHLPGRQVQHIVAHGSVYQEILRMAEEIRIDLIVMASHRPGLEDYLLGPNAARVVRHAPQSGMVVRD